MGVGEKRRFRDSKSGYLEQRLGEVLIAVVELREEISESMRQWLSWAKEKADWYDPTISAEDEFFGKRKHGQSAEEKKPKEMRYYWW